MLRIPAAHKLINTKSADQEARNKIMRTMRTQSYHSRAAKSGVKTDMSKDWRMLVSYQEVLPKNGYFMNRDYGTVNSLMAMLITCL